MFYLNAYYLRFTIQNSLQGPQKLQKNKQTPNF